MYEHADDLTRWFADQLDDASDVRIERLDRNERGHSAETLLLTLVWHSHAAAGRPEERSADVVLRIRPPKPGLLEPYDLGRQFDILRALEATPVRSPKALWYEPSGAVLDRAFYVMGRSPGNVYERGVPAEVAADGALIRRMSEGIAEQLAAIHTVDLVATGLDRLGAGSGFVE
ncbi:MAG: phosphotransferase, partial [Acidimicrobiales bacterium]|nr:phosphotransferase [Acidimicrobiales bacterium]